ncbi:MAG: right-handed parallel beta-helix repeat-containing protein [Acidobacteriota bacterium]|nr:right-handed parallel beta-helix repeat-containing protein [Acidobacteriota bacterium]
MKNISKLLVSALTIFVFTLAFTAIANAQATRTWVSGVGDDANPCSRTAPCRTFAGAISKTANGGEMNALDPGGFGPVNVTKSMTIDGSNVGHAAILASGANGILINASANDTIILRNLTINGAGTGINGIRILAAKAVYIENCRIFNFKNGASLTSGRGVSDERTTGGALYITGTTVENNEQTNVFISPSPTGVVAVLDNVRLLDSNSNSGLAVRGGSTAAVRNSVISANNNFGIVAEADLGGTNVTVENCLVTNNATGVAAVTGAPSIYLSNVTISGNNTGVNIFSGSIYSFGNNKIVANSINLNTPFTATLPLQ